MPNVSVVTPCYNSEKYIGQTIESVQKQSFVDWEHVVVDDGSTDNSTAVIEANLSKDRRLRFVPQSNHGVSNARNNGFMAASKDSTYLLFLDADDCLKPTMLEKLVQYLDIHSDVGMVYCGHQFINSEGIPMSHSIKKFRYVPYGLWLRKLKPSEPETPFVSVFTLCGIIPSISLMRRSVFEQANGFDESFGHHHEDADLFLRIALLSKIHFLPNQLVLRRCHPGQNTADSQQFRDKVVLQEQKLYSKWRFGEGLAEEQKTIVKEAWQFKQGRFDAYLAFLRGGNYWRQGKLGVALRCCLGGMKRYILSFLNV